MMKTLYATVDEYTIADVSADAGREKPTKDFHVIKSDEFRQKEHIFRPSRSNHFSVFLLKAGQFTIQSNLIKYTLNANSLFIIPPGIVHQFCTKDDDTNGILLQFTKDFLSVAELSKKHIDAFTFFSSQHNPHLSLNKDEADILESLMMFLREKDLRGEEHPFKKEVIHHSFNLFMFEMGALFRKYQGNETLKLTRKEDLLMTFMKMVGLHFKEERSVQYYADHLFVTPKHLSKTVKEITGKTSGEFIDEMVITEAKILLDDPVMSVGNVADALHFSDQFFFSKFFKNHTGVNPSEYKSTM